MICTTLLHCKYGDDLMFSKVSMDGLKEAGELGGGCRPPPICKQNDQHKPPLLQAYVYRKRGWT